MSSPRSVSHVIRDAVQCTGPSFMKSKDGSSKLCWCNILDFLIRYRFILRSKLIMRRCSGGHTCLISGLKVQGVYVCQ